MVTFFVMVGILETQKHMENTEKNLIPTIKFADSLPSDGKAVDWDKILKDAEKAAYIFEREDEYSKRVQSQGCPA